MPTFNDPVADADELREAVRGLAHATRSIEDPTTIYPVLGSISSALASLTQSLHQLGEFHDGPGDEDRVDERRPARRPRFVVPRLVGAAPGRRDDPPSSRDGRPRP